MPKPKKKKWKNAAEKIEADGVDAAAKEIEKTSRKKLSSVLFDGEEGIPDPFVGSGGGGRRPSTTKTTETSSATSSTPKIPSAGVPPAGSGVSAAVKAVADRHANLTNPGPGYRKPSESGKFRCRCEACTAAAAGGHLPPLVVTLPKPVVPERGGKVVIKIDHPSGKVRWVAEEGLALSRKDAKVYDSEAAARAVLDGWKKLKGASYWTLEAARIEPA